MLTARTVTVLIVENVTRWEGKYRAIERFLKLQQPLSKSKELKAYFAAPDQRKDVVKDLFETSFFRRLGKHKTLLEVFHSVSKTSQSESTPSLCWVVAWIWKLEEECRDGSEFGNRLLCAVEERLVAKYLTGTSLALKAALLNPYLFSKVKEEIGHHHEVCRVAGNL